MGFGMGLGAGLKALTAARLGVQTAGHNISNVNTLGYTRQRMVQSASSPFGSGRFQIGSGVDVDTIARLLDEGLETRMRTQIGLQGSAELDHSRWKEIEGFFDEPSGGLSSSFSDLFGRMQKLQTDPLDRSLRAGIVQGGKTLAQGFNLLATRFQELGEGTFGEVKGLVEEVNAHARTIADLNAQINAIEANGSVANDLRDTRERHVKEIGQLMDTRALERSSGALDLQVGGYLLVSGGQASSLSVTKTAVATQVVIGNTTQAVAVGTGRIGALLRHEQTDGPQLLGKLDELARSLALEWNRVHTTGVPRTGPFTSLASHYGATDGNQNGSRLDELLSQAGLPFEVQNGELYVSVTNTTTKDIERTRVAIDPGAMTMQQLSTTLDAIDHLNASIDPTGRLRVQADPGYGFDFATRLDTAPDTFGSFGSSAPSFASGSAGPFNLTVPSAFSVVLNGTPQTINLTAATFKDPTKATADELVTAINAQLGATGTARNVGDRLVIRSSSSGTTASMSLTDGAGSPLAAMGFLTGTTRNGTSKSVAVSVEGQYTGGANGKFVFVADQNGQIGVTPGLTVSVYDRNGAKVSTLNVGQGYAPGDPIEIADGVKVAFGAGTLNASAHDVFALDVLADSDTSDVLVALGMNSFFWGSSAADLEVNRDIEANPDLIAGDLGSPGENLKRLMSLRGMRLEALGDASIEDYYTTIVGDVGFRTAGAEAQLLAQDELMQELQSQRDATSGVNLDEETVDMTRYQQAYEAAARFISVVTDLTNVLFQIGR